MHLRRSETLRRLAIAVSIAWIAACAPAVRTIPPGDGAEGAAAPGQLTPQGLERSKAELAIGASTKADVRAALGPAAAELAFESGYEVWVYRIRAPAQAKRPDGELVLLFAPSGALSKTRSRHPSGTAIESTAAGG